MSRLPDDLSGSSLYWRFFNFMVRRVVAVCFTVGGSYAALASVPIVLPGGTVVIDGARTDDMVIRAFTVVFPLVVALLGIALFRSKPFVPSWGKGSSVTSSCSAVNRHDSIVRSADDA